MVLTLISSDKVKMLCNFLFESDAPIVLLLCTNYSKLWPDVGATSDSADDPQAAGGDEDDEEPDVGDVEYPVEYPSDQGEDVGSALPVSPVPSRNLESPPHSARMVLSDGAVGKNQDSDSDSPPPPPPPGEDGMTLSSVVTVGNLPLPLPPDDEMQPPGDSVENDLDLIPVIATLPLTDRSDRRSGELSARSQSMPVTMESSLIDTAPEDEEKSGSSAVPPPATEETEVEEEKKEEKKEQEQEKSESKKEATEGEAETSAGPSSPSHLADSSENDQESEPDRAPLTKSCESVVVSSEGEKRGSRLKPWKKSKWRKSSKAEKVESSTLIGSRASERDSTPR